MYINENDIYKAEDKVIEDAINSEIPSAMFYHFICGVHFLAAELIKEEKKD